MLTQHKQTKLALTAKSHNNRSHVRQIIQMKSARFVFHAYGGIAADFLSHRQVFRIISYSIKRQLKYSRSMRTTRECTANVRCSPIVAMPAPRNISNMPRIRARQACHRQRDVILPRTTCTFHVAPEAGCARRTGGPSDMFLRLCHCDFEARAWCMPIAIHHRLASNDVCVLDVNVCHTTKSVSRLNRCCCCCCRAYLPTFGQIVCVYSSV